jgi:cell division protein FtsZ
MSYEVPAQAMTPQQPSHPSVAMPPQGHQTLVANAPAPQAPMAQAPQAAVSQPVSPAPQVAPPNEELPTPIAPLEPSPLTSKDMLMAKMKAFKESQDIKQKHSQPEQLSMNMELEQQSLEEARRMAREVLSSPFANQNLEVPAFIRKKQNFDLNS